MKRYLYAVNLILQFDNLRYIRVTYAIEYKSEHK